MAGSRPLIVLLATVAGVAATVAMGRWQLDRADQKRAIQDLMEARGAQPPLTNAQLPCTPEQMQGLLQRRVRLQGRWMDGLTVWLDNRPMAGRTGRIVLTPLKLTGAGPSCPARTLLVQRGWVPRDPRDRLRLPPLPATAGVVTLTGVLVPAPSRLFELGPEAPASTSRGRMRQNVDPAALAAEWQLALLPGSVQQTADETPPPTGDAGLLRQWWQPSGEVGKHQAYAAQWFAMATVMVVLYVWLQWWRPRSPGSGRTEA